MEFDGKESVWCPIGDFFGSGIGLNPMQGWYRTVAKDGTMTCRWVMPYQRSGKVSLLNLGGAPVDAELEVKTGAWTWDEHSMYFHAGSRGQYPVPTRPRSIGLCHFEGRGVYVGDTLTIMNPVERAGGAKVMKRSGLTGRTSRRSCAPGPRTIMGIRGVDSTPTSMNIPFMLSRMPTNTTN